METDKQREREDFFRYLDEVSASLAGDVIAGHVEYSTLGCQDGLLKGAALAGLITEDEFESLKAKFLARIQSARLVWLAGEHIRKHGK